MLVNLVLSEVPRPFTTAMIATEIPAAIKPYSIAVAPELSFKKRITMLFIRRSTVGGNDYNVAQATYRSFNQPIEIF